MIVGYILWAVLGWAHGATEFLMVYDAPTDCTLSDVLERARVLHAEVHLENIGDEVVVRLSGGGVWSGARRVGVGETAFDRCDGDLHDQ